MKFIPDRLKHKNLFIITFFITVVVFIIVSVTITWTTIRMSEQFFIEKYSITNSKVINEIKGSFEDFHYSVVMASNNFLLSSRIKSILTEEVTNSEKLKSTFQMGQHMKNILSNLESYNIEIFALGENGDIYSTNRHYWPVSDEELKESAITKQTLTNPNQFMYQFDQKNTQSSGAVAKNVVVASKALMNRFTGNIYGALYFAIQESEFRKFYSSYTSPGNDVYVINQSGVIVSSSQPENIGQKSADLLKYTNEIEDSFTNHVMAPFNDKEQIILMEYLPSSQMYIINTIDKETAIGDLINRREIILISMGIVLVALVIVFFITKGLTNSLSTLVKQIADASKYDFHQYINVTGTYETKQIATAFNSMLDEVHQYVDKLMLAQKQQRNAELAALQQQINPHFLYNTLTSIKFMVKQGGREEAEETITAFISLLQNTIGNVSEQITVKAEIENLKNYVFINQKRYGNRIRVNYFIASDCEDNYIPKLILQPFIENSFFHAFNRKAEGYINVLVWHEEDRLICEVVDNGDGMEVEVNHLLPNSKKKQQLFSGIGITNVHERVQHIYGVKYGVTISSQPGDGTKVRITLPYNCTP